jgi:hypothetical protein
MSQINIVLGECGGSYELQQLTVSTHTHHCYPVHSTANTQHDRATARLTYAVDVGDGGLRQVVVDHHLHALEVDAYAVMRITGQISDIRRR